MPSLQSRIFRFILNHRHLLRFQLKRNDVFDFNTSIAKFREDCEKGAAMLGRLPEDIIIENESICGMKAEWIIPGEAQKDKVIFYTHGGGYVSGSCSDHRGIVSKIAKQCRRTMLLFEYRLAPENPFPAALDDSLRAYQWLLEKGTKPENIIIAGESAGGGLCLATLLALRDKAIPLPAAAVAISPWADLKCTGESYKTKNKVSLAPLNSWTVFSKYYCGDIDPCNPWISPVYGDLRGLPPIFIAAGMDDELVDDSISFAEKAKQSGVDVTLKLGENMVHCYPLLPSFIPEAKEAMDEICSFIKKHLN